MQTWWACWPACSWPRRPSISATFEYYHQTVHALDLRQFAVGISKGTTYGILIAFAGCLRGMQCGRSAQAVGQATTSAVVTSILFIIMAALSAYDHLPPAGHLT